MRPILMILLASLSGVPLGLWLRRNLALPRPPETFHRFHVRHDQGALVRRWAQVAGPENVTVVVLDPARPRFVFSAFERMLGLPDGLLADAQDDGRANRGLTGEPDTGKRDGRLRLPGVGAQDDRALGQDLTHQVTSRAPSFTDTVGPVSLSDAPIPLLSSIPPGSTDTVPRSPSQQPDQIG